MTGPQFIHTQTAAIFQRNKLPSSKVSRCPVEILKTHSHGAQLWRPRKSKTFLPSLETKTEHNLMILVIFVVKF